MINPLARRAMFERFQQRIEPRHTMAQVVRNPGLRRYAFGGEVPIPGGIPTPRPGPMPAYQPPDPALQTSPQPMSRTIPNPRTASNPLMPGPSLSTTSGSPYRPDPLSGWNPFGAPGSPQAGTGTEPGFTWPSMGAARQPYVPGQGGGFGNGRIQTFAHGGSVEGNPGTGSFDLGTMEGLGAEPFNPLFPIGHDLNQNPGNEAGPSTTAYGGDAQNMQDAMDQQNVQGEYGPAVGIGQGSLSGFGYGPSQGWAPGGLTQDQTWWVNYPGVGNVPMGVPLQGWGNPSDPVGLYNISGGHVSAQNRGGAIPRPQVPLQGYGKDTVPAALTPGEVVIPKPGDTSNARRKYLLSLAKNQGRKRYQAGGKVGAQLEDPNFDPLAFLQEQDHEDNLTPEDLETRRKVQAMLDERERKARMNERQ